MWRISGSIVLILVLGVTSVSSVQSVEYYFDSEAGSDENKGTSAAQPYQSLAKLAELELKPGDVVHFKRGSVWRGQPDPPQRIWRRRQTGIPGIRSTGRMVAA